MKNQRKEEDIPGVIQGSGTGKEALAASRLERATIASRKARVKAGSCEESRRSQNRFLNHERYITAETQRTQRENNPIPLSSLRLCGDIFYSIGTIQ